MKVPPGYLTLFAYGTLRTGESANSLLGDGKLLAPLAFLRYARRLSISTFEYSPDRRSELAGEVWGVRPETLEAIDAYEGHPDLWRRSNSQVWLPDGSVSFAYVYYPPDYNAPKAPMEEEFSSLNKKYKVGTGGWITAPVPNPAPPDWSKVDELFFES